MARFAKGLELLVDRGELRRMYWVCGSQRVLVEEFVDTLRAQVGASTWDDVRLTVDQDGVGMKEVLSALNTYPADADARKMVTVRRAQRLTNWSRFEEWATTREIPQTVVCFVSEDDKADTEEPHIGRIAKTGRLVRCDGLSDVEAVEWIERRVGSIERGVARRLWQRVGRQVSHARDVLDKAAVFQGEITDQVVEELCTPTSDVEFTDALMGGSKVRCMEIADGLDHREISRIIGLLDVRLDTAWRVHDAQRRSDRMRDIVSLSGLRNFQVTREIGHARGYDSAAVVRRYQALAFADHWLSQGQTKGVLETLVAMW